MGFEPMTCCLRNSCSTPELHWLLHWEVACFWQATFDFVSPFCILRQEFADKKSKIGVGVNPRAESDSLRAVGRVFRTLQGGRQAGSTKFGNERVFGRAASPARQDQRTPEGSRSQESFWQWENDRGRCYADLSGKNRAKPRIEAQDQGLLLDVA